MIERERRFLLDRPPGDVGVVLGDGDEIVQGYLMTEPAAVRVRRREGAHTLTIKTGRGLSRTEIERPITAAEFDALWEVATEFRITKRRHLVPLPGGRTAEIDQFTGTLTGHRLVEVEFDSDEAAAHFDPPGWFGREVTDDGRYTNAALARNGWPDDE